MMLNVVLPGKQFCDDVACGENGWLGWLVSGILGGATSLSVDEKSSCRFWQNNYRIPSRHGMPASTVDANTAGSYLKESVTMTEIPTTGLEEDFLLHQNSLHQPAHICIARLGIRAFGLWAFEEATNSGYHIVSANNTYLKVTIFENMAWCGRLPNAATFAFVG
ncbi:MAG: hypothetical protein H6650_11985 [Ardenticatenales bacterium]|nr:hypothetical protein [Ardenticatenales bacterium]